MIRRALTLEPVRLYSIAVALITLAAAYIESLPVELWIAVAAAVFLGGRPVRAAVTPMAKLRRRIDAATTAQGAAHLPRRGGAQ